MKSFSLTVLAILICAAIVSAIPAAPNSMPAESEFVSPGKIPQQIKEGFRKFTCTNGVIAKVLIRHGLRDEFLEFLKFKGVLMTDFVACSMAGRIGKIFKCLHNTVKMIPEYFAVPIEDLNQNHSDVAEEIKQHIATECEHKSNHPAEKLTDPVLDIVEMYNNYIATLKDADTIKDLYSSE